MCDLYAPVKHDFLYRGDIIEDVPIIALDGKSLLVPNSVPDVKEPWIPLWKRRKKGSMPDSLVCMSNLRPCKAVIMTRTCEGDKFSGVKRVYPALYLAPIRPLSDFSDDHEDGVQFAEAIAKGFPPKDGSGDRTECYRFALVPACAEHHMEAGLVCFREMQPVHLKYLVDAKKPARLSTKSVHALLDRFQKFMMQSEKDDIVDNEKPGAVSSTVTHYKDERKAEDSRNTQRNAGSGKE